MITANVATIYCQFMLKNIAIFVDMRYTATRIEYRSTVFNILFKIYRPNYKKYPEQLNCKEHKEKSMQFPNNFLSGKSCTFV